MNILYEMKRNVIAIEHSGISSMKWGVTLLLLNTVNILYEMKRNVIAIEHSGISSMKWSVTVLLLNTVEYPLWSEA